MKKRLFRAGHSADELVLFVPLVPVKFLSGTRRVVARPVLIARCFFQLIFGSSKLHLVVVLPAVFLEQHLDRCRGYFFGRDFFTRQIVQVLEVLCQLGAFRDIDKLCQQR